MNSPNKSSKRYWPLLIPIVLSTILLAGDSIAVPQLVQSLDSSAILDHLNTVINWYRHSTTKVQSAGLPSDEIYQANAQSIAAQCVKSAFQSAKAEAALLPAPQRPP